MKVRILMVDADGIAAGDVADILRHVFNSTAPAALPAPAAPAAQLDAPPVDRAPAKRGPRRQSAAAPPRSPEAGQLSQKGQFECGNCGREMPEGRDRRSPCLHCAKKNWIEKKA